MKWNKHPSRLRPVSGKFAVIAVFSSMVAAASPALAAAGLETFGPGKVDCQSLGGHQLDCLLTSLRITDGGNNVATFNLATLPAAERKIFQAWCSGVSDNCTVEIQGARQTAAGSRLSRVNSIRWTRPLTPRNQAAARAAMALGTTAVGGGHAD